MTPAVLDLARNHGFDLAGVAKAGPAETWGFYRRWVEAGKHGGMSYLASSLEQRRRLDSVLPGTASVVAVGLNCFQPQTLIPGQPLIAKYALGRDYHRVIRSRLKRLGQDLSHYYPQADWRPAADSAPILEREWAQRAGLGWFGKNTCLINSKRGSWFLLGFLLTTAEMDPTDSVEGGCGTCRACIDACPTQAIIFEEGRWQVDGRRCISYWTIEHKGEIPPDIQTQMGPWTFGCDVCQDVCPFNHPRSSQPLRATVTTDSDMLAHRAWPGLLELTQISEEDWDRLTRGSPVRRAGWEGLRRNARVSLQYWGNLSPDGGVQNVSPDQADEKAPPG
jgi:epoxyqueuosine reductase